MKQKLVIAGIILAVTVIGAGAAFWIKQSNQPRTKQEAIEQAKNYQPKGMVCASVLTPATHTATGAEHTFPSACVPPGWEPAQ